MIRVSGISIPRCSATVIPADGVSWPATASIAGTASARTRRTSGILRPNQIRPIGHLSRLPATPHTKRSSIGDETYSALRPARLSLFGPFYQSGFTPDRMVVEVGSSPIGILNPQQQLRALFQSDCDRYRHVLPPQPPDPPRLTSIQRDHEFDRPQLRDRGVHPDAALDAVEDTDRKRVAHPARVRSVPIDRRHHAESTHRPHLAPGKP